MSTTAYQWLNIIALVSFLGFFLQKKLGTYFGDQRTALEKEMKSASGEHDRIQKEYLEIQKSVANLDVKISDLKSFSVREIEFEMRRIETEAARVLEKIAVDGEARIKNEAERTKKNLEKELFESALILAKESLQKNLKDQNPDWISHMIQPEASGGKKNYAS